MYGYQQQRPVIARAIDLGSGFVKFVTGYSENAVKCDLFPSIATCHRGQTDVVGDDLIANKRDTIRVNVGDKTFEVGKDARKTTGAGEIGRVRGTDYCETDEYMALTYGALAYMKTDVIDVLVVGLPISTLNRYKDELKSRLVGTHVINSETTVEILNVVVLSQPRGGFYDALISPENAKIGESMQTAYSLVVDPGYFTLDWLLTEGTGALDQFSGAANDCGMSTILDAVAVELARDFGADEQDFLLSKDDIDRFLITGKPFVYRGRPQPNDVDHYRKIGRDKAAEFIPHMLAKLKEKRNFIENIILVGGSHHIYKELLEEVFEGQTIHVSDNTVFSNVRGFQFVGAKKASQMAAASQVKLVA
jgi:plasmid segregation protein ParM